VGLRCALLAISAGMGAEAMAQGEVISDDEASMPETVHVEALTAAEEPARATRHLPTIDEIVVTVNKRAENVQEVSSAVSAFSGKMLADNNIQDFAALAEFTPGMVTRNEESISIRGVGKARGGTSPVAFHADGFILEGRAERFYDLSAIEVVRGPSGTVYGRNATAGAINVKWAPPELVYGAGGDVRFGSYDERETRAWINLPLFGEDDPRLAARVAAMRVRRNGYFDNLLADDDGDDPGGVDDRFGRIYLSSEPTDNLRLALRLIENRTGGTIHVASPSLQTRRSGILEEFGAQPLPDDLLQVRSRMFLEQPQPWGKLSRVTGDLTWRMSELPLLGDVDLDITGGRMRTSSAAATDLDGTEEPITETRNDERADAANVEIRLTSQYDSRFKWLLGAFWYDRDRIGNLYVDARTREDCSSRRSSARCSNCCRSRRPSASSMPTCRTSTSSATTAAWRCS
jgi:iron complex outermembrane recepter protein